MRKQNAWWCRWRGKNPSWGYDRIVGALANLGHRLSDQTVGNILSRRDIPPAPQRKKATTLERLYPFTPGRFGGHGLLHDGSSNAQRVETYYVLFFIHLRSPGESAGFTPYPIRSGWSSRRET